MGTSVQGGESKPTTLTNRSSVQGQRSRTLTLAILLGPAGLMMLLFFVASLLILFRNSFYHFTGMQIVKTFSVEAYVQFFTDPFFRTILATGFRVGFSTSILTLLIGYPAAYAMTGIKDDGWLIPAFVIVFSPLLTSVIVRSYGWLLLLADTGMINYLLIVLKLLEEPVHLLYNHTGVTIGLVHVFLPFGVFPILSVLLQMDPVLKDAAADLGANRLRTFWHVTLPNSLPGVVSAFQLTFVLSMSAFVTPKLLGGGRVMVLPRLIYENIADLNWPLASVQAMVLTLLVLTITFVVNLLFEKAYTGPEG